MADPLKTGLSGLLAFQRAIATTSHNIANANTDGYSRQRVDLVARPPEMMGFGYIGHGTQVNGISRIQDQFVEVQLQTNISEQSRTSTYHTMLSRIDSLLAEDQSSLAQPLQDFFSALQDVNSNPSSYASRQTLLSAANNLAGRFHTIQGQLDSLQQEVNSRVSVSVNDINSITANIAKLNETIVSATAQSGGEPPNDLLDQRDVLVGKLAELTSVRTVMQDDGALNVYIGNGLNMVVGNQATKLTTMQDPLEPNKLQVAISNFAGKQIVSQQLSGGSLGGLMDFRREGLEPVANQLGRIAVVMSDQFNQQHHLGLDQNGVAGGDFFKPLQPQVSGAATNTGSGVAAATFTDTTLVGNSDYRLSFDGSAYTLTRLNDNAQISGALPLGMDGIEINVSGAPAAGDSFLIQPTAKAAREFAVAITQTDRVAVSSPLKSSAAIANLGNADISAPLTLDPTHPDYQDTVEIRFNTPPTSFDIVNVTDGTTLSAGVAYSEGQTLDVQGWRVTLNGTPAAGDVLLVEKNTSGGGNGNGQLLSDLQNKFLVGGTASFQQAYGGLITDIGSKTRQADINAQAMDGLLTQTREVRDSVSGVNLDEEAINLTRFQQAYQAAAQVIATADSLFETILDAVRR